MLIKEAPDIYLLGDVVSDWLKRIIHATGPFIPLGPSYVYMRHWAWPKLFHVACSAPSHYLNQCCHMVNKTTFSFMKLHLKMSSETLRQIVPASMCWEIKQAQRNAIVCQFYRRVLTPQPLIFPLHDGATQVCDPGEAAPSISHQQRRLGMASVAPLTS